jgi:hypothetical protein
MPKFSTVAALPKVIGGIVIGAVAFALGIVLAAGPRGTATDWLSFAGALLGAALTVAGSVAVLEWQRTSEIRARRALLMELLDDVYAACVPFQHGTARILQEKCGRSVAEQVKELRDAIQRVHRFRDSMAPKTAAMMRVSDLLSGLSLDDEEVDGWLRGYRFYPDTDLGGLNYIGHELQGTIDKARKLLK